ncbi:MAG: adenylyltransferase/cytidyltransferase family protein [Pseudomonadota bacterium]
MRRVFAAMVGDLFHFGHVVFLRQARALGDHLTVGLVTDRRAAGYKRPPVLSYEERKAVVLACRYVDDVVPLDQNVTNDFMSAGNFSIRAYGAANEAEKQRYMETLLADMDPAYLHRIPYSDGISTGQIIERILNRKDL